MSKYRRRLAMIRQYYEDFQEVEYIENPSNAYINSGIFGTMDLDFYVEFEPTELSQDSSKGVGSIFGSRTDWNQNLYQLTTFNKNATNKGHFVAAKNYGWNDNRVPTANMFLGGKNIIKKEGLKFTRADGTTFNLTSQSFTTPKTIYIFGYSNKSGGAAEKCIFKLYKLQFSKNGTLVRDFIPVRQKSTNKFGLWDRVEGKFYVSPNGTDFVGGADVVRDINDNIYYLKEYVGARGYYSYVDTGIKGNSTDVIKVSVMTTSRVSTGWCWLIGYQTSESNRFGIYHRGSDNYYRFIVDFWRGNGGSSRKYSDVYPNLNQRYDLVVGNDTLDTTNKGFMYDERSNVFILPKYQSINTTSSNDTYCVSEIRAQKANYYNRYYNVEIYKEINNKKVLVLHYIPTQRVEDGVYGFFDTVTKTFHPSQGSQQFTGG